MDPQLMQQILGAGSLGQQQTQADQQLQDFIMRRRAMNAQPTHTGIGAALSGIADVMMGRKEDALRSRQSDLAKQLTGLRGQYGQAWQGTPMGPQAPPGMPDNPPMIPPSAADQSQLAQIGELSGDPIMQKVGEGALSRAQQAPKLALETAQTRRLQQEEQALDTPEAVSAMRGVAHKYGVDFPEGTPAATMRALMPTLEKGYGAEQAAEARKLALAMTGGRFDARFGQQQDQYTNKRFTDLSNALNPMLPKGGLKNYADTINRAQKLGALLTENGQLKQTLTPQDMTEATIALQQMVANGHASQGEVEALMPKGMGSDKARMLQYFTNSPWNANQQAWAARMLHTAAREAETNRHTIAANLIQKLPQFSDLRGADQKRFENVLKAAGMNPASFDEGLMPVEGADPLLGTNPVLSGDVTGGVASPGGGTVDVISPEGKAGKIPAANLDAALKRGFKRAGSR